ncbi:FkbM family methyltransferase [Psychroserpens jangbogonensis]|uniref:FkbM family methyltransferase n=1 Tax=Psychroserpens jangbogonensis TaxID=1484460 RepID=UPI00053D470D|nr:FkbM family methyltransferase [Psychroserpens jangbogonensis]
MKNSIKQSIKNMPFIGNVITAVYNKFKPKTDFFFSEPSLWLNELFDEEKISVVQIGSNDGITGDPLHELIVKHKKWTALFVEPVPLLAEKLKRNYANDSRFVFENAAINDGSFQVFYSVSESVKGKIENLPSWYDQLGSFNKENITKHLNGILDPYIIESKIKGLTLQDLFTKHKISSIDILHIDTEGYDWKVLSQLDFNSYQPKTILFEHKHLSKAEKNESVNYLKNNNYLIHVLGGDYLCLKKESFNANAIKNLKFQGVL